MYCTVLHYPYNLNNYVRPPTYMSFLCSAYKFNRVTNTRTEMYAGRVACCPLFNDVEYVLHALLTLEKKIGRDQSV